jgi:hypothetical protein
MQRADRERSGGPWDHGAYLRVAWSELSRLAFHEAIPRIRARVAPGATHATLELAWARLVGEALASDLEREARGSARGQGTDFGAFLATHPELRDPDRVHRHYSPERLGLERARREFVLPDRLPLPALAPAARPPAPVAGAPVGKRSDRGRDSATVPTEPSLACGTTRNRRNRP